MTKGQWPKGQWPREPRVVINGFELNEAQAMTMRVAVALFQTELQNDQFRDDMGVMGRLYQARLREINSLMAMDQSASAD
jgi:hypothetical protein